MARKLRLEFPGAIYHVINRGNDRAWIFDDDRTKAAFADCLFDAAVRNGWLLHAYAIMGNHFHLAVETPAGNLVSGMQWLQSTFANRFNRLRGERGTSSKDAIKLCWSRMATPSANFATISTSIRCAPESSP